MNILPRAGALALVLAASCMPQPAFAQATDRFGSYADSAQSPCRRWATITPADGADLAEVPKAIYVGGGGNLAMIGVDAPAGAAAVTISGVPAASLLPFRPRRIAATGTTATLLVACY